MMLSAVAEETALGIACWVDAELIEARTIVADHWLQAAFKAYNQLDSIGIDDIHEIIVEHTTPGALTLGAMTMSFARWYPEVSVVEYTPLSWHYDVTRLRNALYEHEFALVANVEETETLLWRAIGLGMHHTRATRSNGIPVLLDGDVS